MVNQGLNLSLTALILITEHRNISDYENKSAKDLIKALGRSIPKPNFLSFLKKMQISIENFFMILKIIDIFLN